MLNIWIATLVAYFLVIVKAMLVINMIVHEEHDQVRGGYEGFNAGGPVVYVEPVNQGYGG